MKLLFAMDTLQTTLLKFALEECGLCSAQTAPPLLAIAEDHAQQIRQHLPKLLLETQSPLSCTGT